LQFAHIWVHTSLDTAKSLEVPPNVRSHVLISPVLGLWEHEGRVPIILLAGVTQSQAVFADSDC
jgi:hypothetical protein